MLVYGRLFLADTYLTSQYLRCSNCVRNPMAGCDVTPLNSKRKVIGSSDGNNANRVFHYIEFDFKIKLWNIVVNRLHMGILKLFFYTSLTLPYSHGDYLLVYSTKSLILKSYFI